MAEHRSVAHRESKQLAHSHAGRYVLVWGALIVLTFVTWGLSRFHIPGALGIVIALVIATAKGTLVALFFMHLWDQRGANRLVFVTSLVFVALLIGLTLADYATRFPLALPPGSPGALPAQDYAPQPFEHTR